MDSTLGSDDPNLEKIPNIVKWVALCNEASAKFGKSISIAPEQKQHLIDAGFHDVRDDIYKVCQGLMPKFSALTILIFIRCPLGHGRRSLNLKRLACINRNSRYSP